jgi:glycosyltransferase involved in cell wall biosynthesis
LSRVRVLSVIHGPTFGGAHNQLLRLHRPLQARGFETIAVLPAEADAAAARIEAAGIEVHRERLGRLRASADPRPQIDFWRRLPGDVRRLAALVSLTGAELAQVHGIQNPQGAIAARRRGAAVVWQLPDTRAPISLRRALMPIVTRHADAIVSWGARVASEHPGAERFGERLVIVYPPVDPVEFAPDADVRRRARDRLGVDEGRPLVGTVGVRNPHKGHLDLVRAAAIVRRDHPEAAFRVLGAPSPAHPTLDRRLAAEAARLGLGIPDDLDLVDPGTEVASLIQALDVFVMSSPARSEGMPTAILEAMAAAKPVVATDVGSTAELVVEGDTALLVAPGRPALAAAAIARLLDDAALRSAFGDAGRRRALAAFDLDDLADRHARAYEIALAHGRARGRRR